ncbi:MAG: sulfite exporter TauE/SafE family protein [Pseudomonadota bacterium]
MTPTDPSPLAALTLGLLGSSHCLVMCGGISAALGLGTAPERRHTLVLLFQLGRVLTYMALGAGLGGLAAGIVGLYDMALPVLRILSALLLVSMGLTIANWWPGLVWLERAGQTLWKRIQPLAQRHMPVRATGDAVILGLYWGFLPCGLIYTALAWSSAAGDATQSALLMGCFGLGTAPAMFATGLVAQRLMALLQAQRLRQLAGLLLISAGVWTAYFALSHANHAEHGVPGAAHSVPESDTHHSHHHH